MATLINPDGSKVEVRPAHGRKFRLEELQELVGGYVESVPTTNGKRMYVDEEGRLRNLPRNDLATRLLPRTYIVAGNFICGPALVCEKGEG